MLLEQTYSFLLLTLLLMNDLPQLLRRKRHINIRDTQRIGNRACNCRRRTDCTGLTDPLHTKRIDSSQCDSAVSLKAGKLRGNWHGIIRQCCRQELSILTIDDPLIHSLANALCNTTMNLTFNKHWVELSSTVVNRYIARNLCHTSIPVYLDYADVRTIGEDTRLWLPEDRRLEPRFDTRSKCI